MGLAAHVAGKGPQMIRMPIVVMAAVLFAGVQVASADYTAGRSFRYFGKTTYQDKDWNVGFYENCSLPEYSSVDSRRRGRSSCASS